jgi:hypothetical protein
MEVVVLADHILVNITTIGRPVQVRNVPQRLEPPVVTLNGQIPPTTVVLPGVAVFVRTIIPKEFGVVVTLVVTVDQD